MAHLLVFVISFYQNVLPLFLGLFLISNLVAYSWSTRITLFKARKWFILIFSSYYLAHIVGAFYSDDMQVVWSDLETKLSFLIIPLIILTSDVLKRENIIELLKTYLFGSVIAAIFSLIVSTFSFAITENTDVFYYQLLSYFQHPGYFSMYLNFSVAIILILILHQRGKLNYKYYLALTFLIVFIYQLSSRMGLIILIALLMYSLLYVLLPKMKLKTTFFSLILSFSISLAIIYISSQYINRFEVAISQLEEGNENSSAGSRILLWKYSLELFLENPILGVGTGDVDEAVQNKFEEESFTYAVKSHLNPHNQFIQAGVALGIMGVLTLWIPFILPLFYIRKKQLFIYPLFAFIVAASCLTESVFERQSGVVFYALFNTILFFTLPTNATKSEKKLELCYKALELKKQITVH